MSTGSAAKSELEDAPALTGLIIDARYRVEGHPESVVTGERWLLGPGRHRIGRDRHCRMQLPCPSVSRQHVEIDVMETGGLVVADLGSTNGTQVNGRRVLRLAVSGDFELTVGHQRLRFVEQRSPRTEA